MHTCRLEDVALVHDYAGASICIRRNRYCWRHTAKSLLSFRGSQIADYERISVYASLQQITVICADLEREAEAGLVHQSYRWDSDKLSIGPVSCPIQGRAELFISAMHVLNCRLTVLWSPSSEDR
jgi:hypothetical protein